MDLHSARMMIFLSVSWSHLAVGVTLMETYRQVRTLADGFLAGVDSPDARQALGYIEAAAGAAGDECAARWDVFREFCAERGFDGVDLLQVYGFSQAETWPSLIPEHTRPVSDHLRARFRAEFERAWE